MAALGAAGNIGQRELRACWSDGSGNVKVNKSEVFPFPTRLHFPCSRSSMRRDGSLPGDVIGGSFMSQFLILSRFPSHADISSKRLASPSCDIIAQSRTPQLELSVSTSSVKQST